MEQLILFTTLMLLSPSSSGSYSSTVSSVMGLSSTGYISNIDATYYYDARPVLSLVSSATIIDGTVTGDINNPYVVVIEKN